MVLRLRSRLPLFRSRALWRRLALLWWRSRVTFRLRSRFALRLRCSLPRRRSCPLRFGSRMALRLRGGLALRLRLALRRCLALLWLRSRLALRLRSSLPVVRSRALRRLRIRLPRLRLRSRMVFRRLRSRLALTRLRGGLTLLLLLNFPIGDAKRRRGFYVAVGRKRLVDGHVIRASMIRTRKLGTVGAGCALILDLCPHGRSMLLPHGHPLRGTRRNMETTRSAVVTHTGVVRVPGYRVAINVMRH